MAYTKYTIDIKNLDALIKFFIGSTIALLSNVKELVQYVDFILRKKLYYFYLPL